MQGVFSVAVDPRITILLDLYGELLTEKERTALEYYYNDDLSLKEIADNEAAERRSRKELGYGLDERETISRQGVRDTIKRAEAKLIDWESKLHLSERAARVNEAVDLIISKAREISDCNIKHGCYREINDAATEIISAANGLYE